MEHNPLNLIDFYKLDHRSQYPPGTQTVVSNFTARKSRVDGSDKLVVFGPQFWIEEYLNRVWVNGFFNKPKDEVVEAYRRRVANAGTDITYDHIEALHDLGYLPLEIWALPEGTKVPMGVPMLTMWNTHPDFFWLTNYLETSISACVWGPATSATTANRYRELFTAAAKRTGGAVEFVPFQGHDFSARGMWGHEAAAMSGAGHLTSFCGTDTVAAIDFLEDYYGANSDEELIGGSVFACYDDQTEILTESGFVRFADLDVDVKVAQYHEDGTIDFVLPTDYFADPYTGVLYMYKVDNYMDLAITPNHRMVRLNKRGEVQFKKAESSGVYNSSTKFIVSGAANGEVSELTPLEKLWIAFQADGSFSSRPQQYTGLKTGTIPIRFSLKKERKAERLRAILDELGYEYTFVHYDNGYYSVRVQVPVACTPSKSFDWLQLEDKSNSWAESFIDELCHWDGYWARESSANYSNTDKFSVEQVQAVAVLAGRRATFSTHADPRGNRKTLYSVNISPATSMWGNKVSVSQADYNGTVYCVSVPSKMLVVRRNGIVSICGNTEHSVMSMGERGGERETYRRLIEDVYPAGIVSIVSDTYDYWNVLTNIIPSLKDSIMAREGTVVCRPDSGDPVKVICGDPDAEPGTPEHKGSFQILWDTFGGTITDKGFRMLDSHIGLIYGDAITYERAEAIIEGLIAKDFVPSMVFGIGSFTYTYVTRDTYGMAMKATAGVVDGKLREIYKDPATDDGTKKSARGLVAVFRGEDGELYLKDRASWYDVVNCEFEQIYLDGAVKRRYTLAEIRERIANNV